MFRLDEEVSGSVSLRPIVSVIEDALNDSAAEKMVANAARLGMAMAQRRERGLLDPEAAPGTSPFDHFVYAIASDGERLAPVQILGMAVAAAGVAVASRTEAPRAAAALDAPAPPRAAG